MGAVAAVVIGVLGYLSWWWAHPSLLSEESLGLGSGAAAPRSVTDPPLHVGVAGDPSDEKYRETITFHEYQAHFEDDGAGVTVTLSVCRNADGVIGSVSDPLSEFCDAVVPVRDGTKMKLGAGEYLVATLTPSRSGTSTLTGITVNYSRTAGHLWQRGEDRIDGFLKLTVTG